MPGTNAVTEERIGDNLVIQTVYDEDPMSPRDWDNLTIIRGWHRNYVIGDGPNIDTDAYESFSEMIEALSEEEGPLVLLAPLFWYEHSGVACKMGPNVIDGGSFSDSLARFRNQCMDGAGWDSGVAGLVYVTKKAQANVGTPDELLEEAARGEVETYGDYISGRVYGYVVSIETECDHGDTHSDVLDSCWGFIGDDNYAMDEGRAFVGSVIASALGGFKWST